MLHNSLGAGRDFSTWIKDRIEKYGFTECRDYHIFDSPDLGNQTGRGGDRRSVNYYLSLSMAKEIAIVEPKEAFTDLAMQSKDVLSMNDAAKVLKLGYGNITLFRKLREMGILMDDNVPYQEYIARGISL